MQIPDQAVKRTYPTLCVALAAGFVVFGFFYEGIKWLKLLAILMPLLMLLLPVRDTRTSVEVYRTCIALIVLSAVLEIFGTPVFLSGVLYYLTEAAVSLIPTVALISIFNHHRGGVTCMRRLLVPTLIASGLSLNYILLLMTYLTYPFKPSRMIATFLMVPVSLICLLISAMSALGVADSWETNTIKTEELIRQIDSNGDQVKVYLTNYQGALGSYGILIRREHKFIPGMTLVKDSAQYYKCSDAELLKHKSRVFYKTYGENSCTGFI